MAFGFIMKVSPFRIRARVPSETITELPEMAQVESVPILTIELVSKRLPHIAPEDAEILASA